MRHQRKPFFKFWGFKAIWRAKLDEISIPFNHQRLSIFVANWIFSRVFEYGKLICYRSHFSTNKIYSFFFYACQNLWMMSFNQIFLQKNWKINSMTTYLSFQFHTMAQVWVKNSQFGIKFQHYWKLAKNCWNLFWIFSGI